MPRYKYQCESCEIVTIITHAFDEIFGDCVVCETTGSMHKVFNNSFIINKKNTPVKKKTGDLTKEYIEINSDYRS